MQPFRTILFAADFSENSQEAFRVACSLAVENKTRLIVLHVVDPTLVAEEPVSMGQPAVQFFNAARDEVRHESLRRKMREVYSPDSSDRRGVPHERGGRRGGDPPHGRRDRGRPDRDGDARAHRAAPAAGRERRHRRPAQGPLPGPGPALSRPPAATPRRFGSSSTPRTSRTASEAALRVARSLARDHGARLVLLHVVPFDVFPSELAVPVDPRAYRDVPGGGPRDPRWPGPQIPRGGPARPGDAAAEILRMAQEVGCDLIVMGTHGRTGLDRLLLGSVAESVLAKADCPVHGREGPRGRRHRRGQSTREAVSIQ